jgi:hypothetical protein
MQVMETILYGMGQNAITSTTLNKLKSKGSWNGGKEKLVQL